MTASQELFTDEQDKPSMPDARTLVATLICAGLCANSEFTFSGPTYDEHSECAIKQADSLLRMLATMPVEGVSE